MKYDYVTDWTMQTAPSMSPNIKFASANTGSTAFVDLKFPSKAKNKFRTVGDVDPTVADAKRYRSVVVPIDGEMFSEHALPFALAIARRSGGEVRIVNVFRPMESTVGVDHGYPDRVTALLRQHQRKNLHQLMRRLKKETSVKITSTMVEGSDIANALCDAIDPWTDLVVMATHARGPIGRLLSGSIADVLIARLSVPVLLVRGYEAPADLTGNPVLRHVLIPLDGTLDSQQVLEPAIALGSLWNADHTLLRVMPSSAEVFHGLRHSERHRIGGVRELNAKASYDVARDRRRILPRVIRDDGPVADAIINYANTHDADVIALRTRGHKGLKRLFKGSVADSIVRGSSLPVLILPPGQEVTAGANQELLSVV